MHRTLSELAMHDLVTLAVYKEGKKKSDFCGVKGKKGEELIIKNCLFLK